MSIITRIAPALALALFVSSPASAYIGPGAGLTLLSAFWALAVAFVSAIGFLVLWPLRRRLRRSRRNATVHEQSANSRELTDSKADARGH